MKALGALASKQFNQMRVKHAAVVASAKIDASKLVHFEVAFNVTNHVWTQKNAIKHEWNGSEDD